MAGMLCKSIVSLECLSSWHSSMEMVPTPGEQNRGRLDYARKDCLLTGKALGYQRAEG